MILLPWILIREIYTTNRVRFICKNIKGQIFLINMNSVESSEECSCFLPVNENILISVICSNEVKCGW